MILLDGKIIREKIRGELKEKFAKLAQKTALPKLAIIQVGELPESNVYIKAKIKFGESVGIEVLHKKYEENISEGNLIKEIQGLNADPSVGGIIVQLPLPASIGKGCVLNSVYSEKDVDGLNEKNIRDFENGVFGAIIPATPRGIIRLLEHYCIDVNKKKVVIVGNSILIGRPVSFLLRRLGADVTVCDNKTIDLISKTKKADILITATGVPNLINKDYVKEGVVVIDVGITVTKEGKYLGDVNFEEVSKIAGAITPVPGGAGATTVAELFENLYDAVFNMLK